MSGVNGADQTPFKSGGAAGGGLPEVVCPAHEIRKGERINAATVTAMEARKRFLILVLGSVAPSSLLVGIGSRAVVALGRRRWSGRYLAPIRENHRRASREMRTVSGPKAL